MGTSTAHLVRFDLDCLTLFFCSCNFHFPLVIWIIYAVYLNERIVSCAHVDSGNNNTKWHACNVRQNAMLFFIYVLLIFFMII